jgi:hypothetical protein
MRYLSTLFSQAVTSLLVALPLVTSAQSIKPFLDSQHYVFQPWTAQSLSGPLHHLNAADFTLEITRDKIVSDLPYYGRAYVAPMDPTINVLDFSSGKFSYTLTPGKKDGWVVLIKPEDNQEVQQLQLNISSNGYSSLQILFSNRDPIIFNGIVLAPDRH